MCQFIEIDPLDDGMMIRNVKENHVLLLIDNFIFSLSFLDHNPAIPVARPVCITHARAGESLLLVIY